MELYCADCLEVLPQIEDGSVDLVFVDPPYNIGVFLKIDPSEYLDWCQEWIALCSLKLKPNGAFWISHSEPDVLRDLSRIVESHGRKRINWIVWDKFNLDRMKVELGIKAGPLYGAMWKQVCSEPRRSFGRCAEYLIYHADEGEWTAQCDRGRGFIFEPLRAYLDEERRRAGVGKVAINAACGFSATAGGMASRHYFSRSQWCLPTKEHYDAMRKLFNHANDIEYLRREHEDLRREYEDLRREYEDLRHEYEGLRYTFNNPGKVSSVWQIPPASDTKHPTEKPVELLGRIILSTSNLGDLVLDPMMGGGTTGVACVNTGCAFIGIESNREYFEMAQARIQAAQREVIQLGLI